MPEITAHPSERDFPEAAPRPVITPTRPALRPVVITREGTLAPNNRVAVDFGLLGPNRLVVLRGSFPSGAPARGRIEVTCGGTPRTRLLSGSRPAASLELRAGPGDCQAWIANTGDRPERFRFTVRLTLP